MTSIASLVDGVANGRIGPDDRAFQYGDGVFETIAIVDGRPLLWEAHRARLEAGCARLGIQAPAGTLLWNEAAALASGRARAVLKMVVSRGTGGRGYRPGTVTPTRVLSLWPWPPHARDIEGGVAVRVCRTRFGIQPALAGLKHLSRLENVLARAEWADEYAEGLVFDADGVLVSGTMSNVFVYRDGELLTPALTRAGVAGVVRARVLAVAPALGIPCREARIERAFLDGARAIFLTNSIIGVWPVRRLEDRDYGKTDVAARIQRALLEDGSIAHPG